MAFKDAFTDFPVIETGRLFLTELVAEDAEAYHEQQKAALDLSDGVFWQYGFETASADKASKSFEFAHNAWLKKGRIKWGVRLKESGSELIGQCELFNFSQQSKAELGYWLGPSFHNQGFMTEAIQAVVRYAFETMEMHRIYANTSTENAASIAMLKKVGFVQEGILRQDTWRDGAWTDSVLMAILRNDKTAA